VFFSVGDVDELGPGEVTNRKRKEKVRQTETETGKRHPVTIKMVVGETTHTLNFLLRDNFYGVRT
jgi:hypothetical protein